MIRAVIIGGDALAARLDGMPRALAAGLGEEVARLSGELREAVERNLSGGVLQQRSGRLAAGVAVSLGQSGGAVTATLGSDAPYAAIHEYGGTIPAHRILPRDARALAFPWQGRQRFFTGVNLPPVHMPERSFLRSALAEMEPEIRAAVEAAAMRAVSA